MNALLLAAWLMVEVPLVEVPFSVPCKSGVCIIEEAMLDGIIETNAKLVKEIESLREQVKKPVECAKTEITEPSKKHDMTPKPPFKLERNL